MRTIFLFNALPADNMHSMRGIGRYTKEVIYALLRNRQIIPSNLKIIFITSKRDSYFTSLRDEGILSLPDLKFNELIGTDDLPQLSIFKLNLKTPIATVTQGDIFNISVLRPVINKITLNLRSRGYKVVYFNPHPETFLSRHADINIVMVHDLIPILMQTFSTRSKWLDEIKRLRYLYFLKKLELVDTIITNSNDTKDKLLTFMPNLPVDKIHTLHLGVPHLFLQDIRPRCNLKIFSEYPYFVYYGGYDKNKNVPQIVNLFLEFLRRFKIDANLLLVGGTSYKTVIEASIPNNLRKYRHFIKYTDFLEDRCLIKLLKGSKGLFRLSLYEGFGLPEIETLSLGVPVISSNIASINEVIGDIAFLFSPYDPSKRKLFTVLRYLLKGISDSDKIRYKQFVQRYKWSTHVKGILELVIQ